MEGIFTLNYPEYAVSNYLNKLLKKHNFSIYIPTSRQQKGIDLIIHKNETHNIARIQVKSSRTYISDKKNNNNCRYHLWLNNFIEKYQKNIADFYIIYGLYTEPNTKEKINSKNKIWKDLFICYNDKEMFKLLNNARTNENKIDPFFGFTFDNKQLYLGRGYKKLSWEKRNAIDNLLDNKIDEIINFLN